MKKTRTPEELDSLLARGDMGPSRRDAALAAILARVSAERPQRSRRGWWLAGAVTAAAAALILLVPRLSSPPGGSFRAKGGAGQPSKPSLAIECLGAALDACPNGSLLVVRSAGVRGFVSAWAEPVQGGDRIWYFSAETATPEVDSLTAEQTPIDRAVKIGPQHTAGVYRIEVRVTGRPMARGELLLPSHDAVLAQARFLLTVTTP